MDSTKFDIKKITNNIKPFTNRQEYRKQAFTFHPDKNDGCKEEATKKFQQLSQYLEEWKTMEER